MLVAENDGYHIDDAVILIAQDAKADPGALAVLMERSLFCGSDDAGCDSWETQHDAFCKDARNRAVTLLLGEEAALLAGLRDALFDHVLWRIPQGRTLVLTANRETITLDLGAPS